MLISFIHRKFQREANLKLSRPWRYPTAHLGLHLSADDFHIQGLRLRRGPDLEPYVTSRDPHVVTRDPQRRVRRHQEPTHSRLPYFANERVGQEDVASVRNFKATLETAVRLCLHVAFDDSGAVAAIHHR